jgi:hypothetical protein
MRDWLHDWFQVILFLGFVAIALGRVLFQQLGNGKPRGGQPRSGPPQRNIREVLEEIRREALGERREAPLAEAEKSIAEKSIIGEEIGRPAVEDRRGESARTFGGDREHAVEWEPLAREKPPPRPMARPPEAPRQEAPIRPQRRQASQQRPQPAMRGPRPAAERRAREAAAVLRPASPQGAQAGELAEWDSRQQIDVTTQAAVPIEDALPHLWRRQQGAGPAGGKQATHPMLFGVDLRLAVVAQVVLGPPKAFEWRARRAALPAGLMAGATGRTLGPPT